MIKGYILSLYNAPHVSITVKSCTDCEFRGHSSEWKRLLLCFYHPQPLIVFFKWHIRNLRKCLCYTGEKRWLGRSDAGWESSTTPWMKVTRTLWSTVCKATVKLSRIRTDRELWGWQLVSHILLDAQAAECILCNIQPKNKSRETGGKKEKCCKSIMVSTLL